MAMTSNLLSKIVLNYKQKTKNWSKWSRKDRKRK